MASRRSRGHSASRCRRTVYRFGRPPQAARNGRFLRSNRSGRRGNQARLQVAALGNRIARGRVRAYRSHVPLKTRDASSRKWDASRRAIGQARSSRHRVANATFPHVVKRKQKKCLGVTKDHTSIARAVGSAMIPIRPRMRKAAARERTRVNSLRTLVQCVNPLAGSCREFLRPGRPRGTRAGGSRVKKRMSS